MKQTLKITAVSVFVLLALLGGGFRVFAGSQPVLSLTAGSTGGTTGTVQMTVTGDTGWPVQLYYYDQYNTATYAGLVGYIGQNGYLSTSLTSSQYNISGGEFVYATVDGANSAPVVWPTFYNYGNGYGNGNGGNTYINPTLPVQSPIYLSQNNLQLNVGQSTSVIISGGTNSYANYGNGYYVSSNSNSSVASANISGSSLYIYANQQGNAAVTVCSSGQYAGSQYNSQYGYQNTGLYNGINYGGSCASVYVTVTAPIVYYPPVYYPQPVYNPTTYYPIYPIYPVYPISRPRPPFPFQWPFHW